ncbi:MAG: hypothetical protein AAFR93_11530 [Pseudomonadota bacterium]
MVRVLCLLALVAGVCVAPAAQATTIVLDFEDVTNGQILTSSQGVGISATRRTAAGNEAGLAVIFDTANTANSDADLQAAPFNAGVGAVGVTAPLGRHSQVLIIQNSDQNPCGTSCATPNDNARGGVLSFDFTALAREGVTLRAVDLLEFRSDYTLTLDLADGSEMVLSGAGFGIGDDRSGTLDFATYLGGTAPSGVVGLTMTATASAAIDTLTFDVAAVPLPQSLAALALALTGLALVRHRGV